EAVGITHCDDGDAARPPGGEGRAVADSLALGDRSHVDDAALELDHRMHRVFTARGRVDPVERNPGPDQVAVHSAAEKYARGIGERGRQPTIENADFAK